MINFNKLPSKIKIFGETWPIIYLDDPAKVDFDGKADRLYGQFRPIEHQIRIYRGGKPIESVWISLLHELTHLWLQESWHPIKAQDEERMACSLASFLSSIVRDN